MPATLSPSSSPPPWLASLAERLGPAALVLALAATALLLTVALFVVDLTPRVESDFFFASDDPQLQDSAAIEELFPSRPQILLDAAAADVRSDGYVERLGELTEALVAVEGVAVVRSLTAGPDTPADAFESPLWDRLLVAPDQTSTQLLVELDPSAAAPRVVSDVEAVMARFASPEFRLAASGVPFVVEQIRRHLTRDLRIFSFTALAVFGLLVLLLYRNLAIAVGTLTACLGACAATLLLLRLLAVPIGVLTANIATLVFVLTLSHGVYLAARHRFSEMAGEAEPARRLAHTLARTAPPSFWAMVTTLLGFLSLRLTSARPLQELGTAGALGTVVAFAAAYLLLPPFLRTVTPRPRRHPGTGRRSGGFFGWPGSSRRIAGVSTGVLAVLVGVAALGLPRLDTDPALPSYFAPGGEIHRGIERIDRAGGSSPLSLLIRTDDDGRLDREEVLQRLNAAHGALEADPAVGTALSLSVLVQEARRIPFARLIPLPNLLEVLSSPRYQGIARSFVTEDRLRGLVLLRMREQGRPTGVSRRQVVERLRGDLADQGFVVERVGGLYPLQGALGQLVISSLVTGLGGLGLLFLGVGWIVTRSLSGTLALLVCLAGTPVFLFGVLGWLGQPLDLISSPAANVAVAMGIDSMIHLVMAVRRRAGTTAAPWRVWAEVRNYMARPILGAALILGAGFGIFGLSSFPPTQRFGFAVVLGLAMAAALTLLALPRLVGRRADPGDEPSR